MTEGSDAQALARGERAFAAAPVAVALLGLDGVLRGVNEAFTRLLRRDVDDLIGLPALELFAPQDRHLAYVEVAARESGRNRGVFTCRVQDGFGEQPWVRVSWQLEQLPDQEPFVLVYAHDVEGEARNALVADELLAAVEAERAILNAALEGSPDGISIYIADRDDAGEPVDVRLVRMNRVGAAGQRVENLVGRSIRTFFPLAEETGLLSALLETLRSQRTQTVLIEVPNGLGWTGVYENVIVPIDADRVLCTFRDVTRARLDEQRLLHAATHDALTGLPNRVLLRDRIEHALQRAAREDSAVCIAFLDLDGFKTINDTRGHTHGDEVLRQVAARLSEAVRDGDTVARLGGDEFVLVLEGCADEAAWKPVHDRVVTSLAEPILIEDQPVTMRASIGVVFTPVGETDTDSVMRNADIAMYAAKRGGKARYTVFTQQHRRDVLDLAALEQDLAAAVSEGQFELFHQPIHDLSLGRTVGHEALLRWRHPERGLLPPATFLPALEAGGWMVEVGSWVLHEALAHVRERTLELPATPQPGTPGPLVTVNVSLQQLVSGDFVADVRDALATTGVASSQLTLEITESQILPSSRGSVLDQLQELRDLGVRVAVDDFGTGYSSLSHLAELPVDLVKIDRSFLVDLTDRRREAVLRSAIELSAAVGADCVVEGVETDEQLRMVQTTGARFAQGFLLGRPAPFRASTFPTTR